MLSEREQLVCAEIERRQGELVELAADLIAFDTTARNIGDAPRQEAALQEYLAARLRARRAPRSTCGSPTPRSCAASRSSRRVSTSPAGRSWWRASAGRVEAGRCS